MNHWFYYLSISFIGAIFAMLFLLVFSRPMIKLLTGLFVKRLMSDRYTENIWEMVTATLRVNPIKIMENSLRATTGASIERPFGTPRKFLNFDGLVFSPAQLAVLPEDGNTPVDTQVTIGPLAKKPMKLDIPILASAMGYGIGISDKVKVAIAKATSAVGTATNTGEGGFLPEDRANAKHFILQYNTGTWNKEPEILRQADAIEIHIGRGANASAPIVIKPEDVEGRAREILGLKPGQPGVLSSRHKEINRPEDLKTLVDDLRNITGGIPIGVKMCPSQKLEEDLDICIHAKVDFITVDGGQGATSWGAPILQDDFGLPTIYALSRAVRHLKKQGVKDQITLLVSGGFTNPGDCLKALALGADAIYLGTVILWAMTHTQGTKAIPFEPPTQLVYYAGKLSDQFNEEEAAYYLKNFFNSFVAEMKVAVISLGKTSIKQVNAGDLVALDEETSQVTHVPLAYSPASSAAKPEAYPETEFGSYSNQDFGRTDFFNHLLRKLTKK